VRIGVLLLGLTVVGCAARPPYPTYQAPPLPSPPPETTPAPVAPPALPPRAEMPYLQLTELLQSMASDPLPDVSPKAAQQAVAQANQAAIVRAQRTNFYRSVVVYPYYEGAIYEIRTGYRMPTHLVFTAPEVIELGQMGDDEWHVERWDFEQPPPAQTHLVITPKLPDLHTRMVIPGALGRYYLDLRSYSTPEMVAVRWKLPEQGPKPPKIITTGIYYTGYDIQVRQGNPGFAPLEVWDTGLSGKTLLRFAPEVSVQELPNVYAIASDGTRHLLNLHPAMPWLIIPRRIDRLELRHGHENGAAVLISRGANMRAVRCPQSDECPKGVL
jgi:type IV secretory pathway VirB9-like protein